MARVLARKTLSGFVAADDEAKAAFSKVPFNRLAYVEVVRARNEKQHRLLFAGLIGMLVGNGKFPSIESALDALKFATGHVDTRVAPRDISYVDADGTAHIVPAGTALFVPKSIAYANMSAAQWDAWWPLASEACAKWLGTTPDVVRQEAEAA